jgi:rubredoxin
MSKILSFPKIKPIMCPICGCVYEFIQGDKLEVTQHKETFKGVAYFGEIKLKLECPVCSTLNEIAFEENKNEKS